MDIVVKSKIHPTEDIERVRKSIENILGKFSFEIIEHDEFTKILSANITRNDLLLIRRFIHEKRILDAVRVRLLKNFNDLELTTSLSFDKQAAFVEKIRLIDNDVEFPSLGSIEVGFSFETSSEFEAFLDWFSPKTKDGKVID